MAVVSLFSSSSKARLKSTVAQEADCQGEPLEGDILKWVEEKWVAEDDVTIAPLARETVGALAERLTIPPTPH